MDLKNIIGKMRSSARFETNAPVLSDSGGDFDDYSVEPVIQTRCYLRKRSGHRSLNADTIAMVSDYEMAVRFQAALEQVVNNNQNFRVLSENKIFTIDSIALQEESKKSFYILQLTETQAG